MISVQLLKKIIFPRSDFFLKIIDKIEQKAKESSRYGDWVVVIYALSAIFGIVQIFYFNFWFHIFTMIPALLAGLSFYVIWRGQYTVSIFFCRAIFFYFVGIGSIVYKIYSSPVELQIKNNYKNVFIEGQVTSIQYGLRPAITIKITNKNYTRSVKLKISIPEHDALENISIGQKIRFNANIWPSPQQKYKISLPIVNLEILNDIIGRGRVVGNIESIAEDGAGMVGGIFNEVRKQISLKISRHNKESGAGILIAMMIGNTGYIFDHDIENIRKSGFAHLLAISGLHIAIVAGNTFMLARFGMAYFQKFALTRDIKKIAAIVAGVVSYFYLNITNMSVSAVRSFIMFVCFLLAILADRKIIAIRVWSFALIVICIFAPEQIFFPSTQMSFMATLSLIATYQRIYSFGGSSRVKHWFFRMIKYVFMIFVSSFVAGVATLFYEAYHFGQCSLVGLLSNEIAIPITEIIVLPICILIGIFMIFGLEGIFIDFGAIWGGLLCKIAGICSNLQFAYFLTPYMPDISIFLISIGLIFLFLWRLLWFIFGLAFIAFGLFIQSSNPVPILMIEASRGQVIFLNSNFEYEAISPIVITFNLRQIFALVGQDRFFYARQKKCNHQSDYCIISSSPNIAKNQEYKTLSAGTFAGADYSILVVFNNDNEEPSSELCYQQSLVVNLSKKQVCLNIKRDKIITKNDLRRFGNHNVIASDGGLIIRQDRKKI